MQRPVPLPGRVLVLHPCPVEAHRKVAEALPPLAWAPLLPLQKRLFCVDQALLTLAEEGQTPLDAKTPWLQVGWVRQ